LEWPAKITKVINSGSYCCCTGFCYFVLVVFASKYFAVPDIDVASFLFTYFLVLLLHLTPCVNKDVYKDF